MTKATILFADNDPDSLDTRSEFLENAEYRVLKAYTLDQARQLLAEAYIHLAILDIRLVNDDDEKDVSGLTLAKDPAFRHIPKIILTSFPITDAVRESLRKQIDGLQPAVDFLEREEGPEAMLQAVERVFTSDVRINRNLVIGPKEQGTFSLIAFVEPGLEGKHLLNRAEELGDLFRRLFYEKDHIRVDRLLWQRDGRLALVILAFKESEKPESFVVVCGQNTIINEETRRFAKFAPKAPGETGTTLDKEMRAETTHFAANAYTLANNDLENAQTLADLYRHGPDKVFNTALGTLYQETLKAWHQEKPIREKGATLDALYRERLRLTDELTQQYFEERIGAIEAQCPTIGARIERAEETLTIHFNGQSFSYLSPMPFLSRVIRTKQPLLLITVPGRLSGDNILTDASGRAWLTDFAEAGLAPLLWNYVALEAAIRFDWVETKELQRRHELERSLIFTDFHKPDIRGLEPMVHKPARAIQTIRKLAARTVGRDVLAYHRGIFFHATRRLADFDPALPLTSNELARLGHILLSMAMIAQISKQGSTPVSTTTETAELSIADATARIVLVGNHEVRLPPQPFALFHYLYQNANRVCTKEELIQEVLKSNYEEDYLPRLIGRIREKIEDDPAHPRYLITIPNAGYRMILEPK